MILTISLSGISFAGADVGGFFNNPSAELLLRWYQAGTYQPFFRSHAHIDTKRREPWVFGEDWAQKYRNIIRQRYRMLPMWYTWFWESHVSGVPAMRPMFMEWSALKNVFSEETQFMLGRELLVAPVTTENQVSRQVYLPEQEVRYLKSPPVLPHVFGFLIASWLQGLVRLGHLREGRKDGTYHCRRSA